MADYERIQQLTQDSQEAWTHWEQCKRRLEQRRSGLRVYTIGFWTCFVFFLFMLFINLEMALVPLVVCGMMMLGYLAERSSGVAIEKLKQEESESHDRYENVSDELTRELIRNEFT